MCDLDCVCVVDAFLCPATPSPHHFRTLLEASRGGRAWCMEVAVAFLKVASPARLRSRTFTHTLTRRTTPTHAPHTAPRHHAAMSLATLPGPLLAQVVRCLYPQETRWIRDPPLCG